MADGFLLDNSEDDLRGAVQFRANVAAGSMPARYI
jgi:hypothetical protein